MEMQCVDCERERLILLISERTNLYYLSNTINLYFPPYIKEYSYTRQNHHSLILLPIILIWNRQTNNIFSYLNYINLYGPFTL